MRSVFNAWAWLSTALCVIVGTPIVAIIFALTAPFDKGRYAAGRAFRLVAVTSLFINPLWRFTTRGGKLKDPRRPYVVVANHESYADIFLLSCFPWEMKWLSKDTIFKIPLMGWMMRMAGDIRLVRGNRDSAADAIVQCRDRLSKQVSVMIFPEGTRSHTSEMRPFKDGAFRLAIESGAPILPIALAGTRNAMAKGSFQFQPARAIAAHLEPIETTGMSPADVPVLKQRVRDALDEARRSLWRELGISENSLSENENAGVA